MADEQLPKKKDAAPLEGMLGREGRMVLDIAFMGMGLAMCNNLALTAGMSLPSPLLKSQLATVTPASRLAAPAIAPMTMKAPSPLLH